MNKVELVRFNKDYLKKIWELGFKEERPEWKNWDGPYFDDDYKKCESFESFLELESNFFLHDNRRCILLNSEPVGMLSRVWEDKKTRWLEIGITIYRTDLWGKGIGTKALSLWINDTFKEFDFLEHIGLTTWSGNIRMMKSAEKLGMKKEAQIRKVRYHKGIYYDSVSYGILREEWKNKLT
ncbi:MAG: GNAT family N-acetyltransferase [Tissierellia bacterium]|nr:GNAT family N-acetyltransferase [Tissierellia bacterium]